MRELGILVKSLGLNMGQDEINSAMIDLDLDKNGAISFEEFWKWFSEAAVVKFGASSPVAGIASAKLKTQMVRTIEDSLENEIKGAEDFDASPVSSQLSTVNRPSTAGPSRLGSSIRPSTAQSWNSNSRNNNARNNNASRNKVGSWVSRNTESPHLAGRIRPQTAMERGVDQNGRATYKPGSKKEWGSHSWRSMSRTDFRPPSAGFQPPKLNLPSRRRERPQSAQPLIRQPGETYAPIGSTSGFRL